jgi:hypothetical protein
MVVIIEAPQSWGIARHPERLAFRYQGKYGGKFTSFLISQPEIEISRQRSRWTIHAVPRRTFEISGSFQIVGGKPGHGSRR